MRLFLVAIVCAAAGLSGCANVRPIDRGLLASPAMVVGFGEEGVNAAYAAKLVESKTAGGLPGSAPGGGCGCAQ